MFLLVSLGFSSFAQEYKKVSDMLVLRKPEDAKTELDKITSNPKTKDKAAGLYWTFAIYANFYGDSALSKKYPGSDAKAFDALDSYAQQDTSLKALKENSSLTNDFAYIRATGFNHGVTGFNTKSWQAASDGFNTTVRADKFMEQHRIGPYSSPSFVDTNTYLYAGYAAQNSGNLAGAVVNYKYLTDKGIVVQSSTFENSIYYTMLGYYVNSNNQDDFKKYSVVVKKLLPQYGGKIDQMSMQNLTANSSLTDLMAKYKASASTLTEAQYATYADAFSQPDKDELAKLDSATQSQVKLAAADAYSKAFIAATSPGAGVQEVTIGKNGSSASTPAQGVNLIGIYAYDASVLYTNVYQLLDDRFNSLKGGDASLKAKRDETERLESQYGDSAIVWATNTYNTYKVRTDLSKREINYTKASAQTLYVIYDWKKERARGVNPKDYDKYEALAKQFDAETDKYDAMYKAAPKTN